MHLPFGFFGGGSGWGRFQAFKSFQPFIFHASGGDDRHFAIAAARIRRLQFRHEQLFLKH